MWIWSCFHCSAVCTVCFMYFWFLLFTAVKCACDISSYNLIGHRIWYAYFLISLFPLSMEHCLIFFIWTMKQLSTVMSIWMFLIALSVLLIYNFLSTPINEMFLLSRVLCVFSISIFISINMCAYNMRNRVQAWSCIFLVCLHVCQ